jgi:hypothetical protein
MSRRFGTTVTGNTIEELELAALDAARKLFGEDVQLTIMQNYGVFENGTKGPAKYYSYITVNEVETAQAKEG